MGFPENAAAALAAMETLSASAAASLTMNGHTPIMKGVSVDAGYIPAVRLNRYIRCTAGCGASVKLVVPGGMARKPTVKANKRAGERCGAAMAIPTVAPTVQTVTPTAPPPTAPVAPTPTAPVKEKRPHGPDSGHAPGCPMCRAIASRAAKAAAAATPTPTATPAKPWDGTPQPLPASLPTPNGMAINSAIYAKLANMTEADKASLLSILS